MYRLIFVLSTLFFLSACASFNYHVQIQNPDDSKTQHVFSEKMRALSWEDVEHIPILTQPFPSGLASKGGTFISKTKQVEILHTVYISPEQGDFPTADHYPEDEEWRNRYCEINTIFAILTLDNWPPMALCDPYESNFESTVMARVNRIHNELRKAAVATGGNAVALLPLEDKRYEMVNKDRIIMEKSNGMAAILRLH